MTRNADEADQNEANKSVSALRTEGLGRRFGRHWALAHLDLEVRAGEAVLLAGANGSGKTTLLRLLAGLQPPSSGSLEVFGHDPIKEQRAVRRQLTLVSHESYLYPRLTALETLAQWSRLLGRHDSEQSLVSLLDEVGLADRHAARVGGFSAGMKKRLTLLRTRLEEPRLVLLDEPFAALDPAGQELIETWIEGFRARAMTVIIASHALERSRRHADRGLILERGQLVWSGPAAQLPIERLR